MHEKAFASSKHLYPQDCHSTIPTHFSCAFEPCWQIRLFLLLCLRIRSIMTHGLQIEVTTGSLLLAATPLSGIALCSCWERWKRCRDVQHWRLKSKADVLYGCSKQEIRFLWFLHPLVLQYIVIPTSYPNTEWWQSLYSLWRESSHPARGLFQLLAASCSFFQCSFLQSLFNRWGQHTAKRGDV